MDALPISTHGAERLARVDLSVYGLEAIQKSAYRFTGRCYIQLQPGEANIMEVRLRPKQPGDDPDAMLGEFLNDLLDQRLRSVIAAETTEVRNLILAHALSRANFVRPDLETADPSVDPQQIALPDRERTPK